jgi:hypothetical protein
LVFPYLPHNVTREEKIDFDGQISPGKLILEFIEGRGAIARSFKIEALRVMLDESILNVGGVVRPQHYDIQVLDEGQGNI